MEVPVGDPEMTLREEDVRRLGEYVKPWIREMFDEAARERSRTDDANLLNRAIRVEEELRSQRELMDVRFDGLMREMDQRFVAQRQEMDQRFAAQRQEMDQRFVAQRRDMMQRFDAQDARHESLQREMNLRFDQTSAQIRRTDVFVAIGFTIVTVAVTLVGLLF